MRHSSLWISFTLSPCVCSSINEFSHYISQGIQDTVIGAMYNLHKGPSNPKTGKEKQITRRCVGVLQHQGIVNPLKICWGKDCGRRPNLWINAFPEHFSLADVDEWGDHKDQSAGSPTVAQQVFQWKLHKVSKGDTVPRKSWFSLCTMSACLIFLC